MNQVTLQTFDDLVLGASRPMIIDFAADWCGPCKELGPKLERLSEIYGEEVGLVQIDIDADPELKDRFGVSSIPVVLLVDDGEVLLRIVGNRAEGELRARLDAKLAPLGVSSAVAAAAEDDPDRYGTHTATVERAFALLADLDADAWHTIGERAAAINAKQRVDWAAEAKREQADMPTGRMEFAAALMGAIAPHFGTLVAERGLSRGAGGVQGTLMHAVTVWGRGQRRVLGAGPFADLIRSLPEQGDANELGELFVERVRDVSDDDWHAMFDTIVAVSRAGEDSALVADTAGDDDGLGGHRSRAVGSLIAALASNGKIDPQGPDQLAFEPFDGILDAATLS